MIDFKYHVVSLISVFLAIALGIVIGTTALNGPVLDNLRDQVGALKDDKRALEDQSQLQQTQITQNDEFDAAMAPQLVSGVLAGDRVVVISAGDSVPTEMRDSTVDLLTAAGAQVTGNVILRDAYSDPARADQLQSYATGDALPPGVTLPTTDDAGQVMGALLANVLLVNKDGTAQPDSTILSALAGLSELGLLEVQGNDPSAAEYAVVLTSGVPAEDATARNKALLGLVSQLDQVGKGTVVAGDPESYGEDGLIGAIRSDGTTNAAVSTVDNANVASGRISTIYALAAEAQGRAGQYGVGEGAQPVPPLPGS